MIYQKIKFLAVFNRVSTTRQGQASLAFIILIGGIIVEIAIAGALINYFFSASGFGERLLTRATSAAYTGFRDAQIKIIRNKEFGQSGYSINIGSDKTDVEVIRDEANNAYVYTIISTGSAGSRRKKIRAELIVDKTTGFVQFQKLSEEAVE